MCCRGPETNWLHTTDGRLKELAVRKDLTDINYIIYYYLLY
jgi:hypothetical protein